MIQIPRRAQPSIARRPPTAMRIPGLRFWVLLMGLISLMLGPLFQEIAGAETREGRGTRIVAQDLSRNPTMDRDFLTRIQMGLNPDKSIYHDCANCHGQKSYDRVLPAQKPRREHQGIELRHGGQKMSCHHCHDKNNHNFLRQEDEFNVTFRQPSGVCFQCHSETVKDWGRGLHGQRVGGWNREKTQWQCNQCHKSHSVTFARMRAVPPPRRPDYGISKSQSSKGQTGDGQ